MAWYDSISKAYVANVMNTLWQEQSFDPFALFPAVSVKKDTGLLAEYKEEDLLRIGTVNDYKGIPGAPTESLGDTMEKNYVQYILDEYRFHKDVTTSEVRNADSPYRPIADASRFVINRIHRLLVKNFVTDFFKASTWAADKQGAAAGGDFVVWDNSSSDPVGDVLDWKQEILARTGYEPNRMGITYDVYVALRKNSAIKDDLKTTSDKIINVEKLRQMFDLEELVVLKTVETTAAKGGSATTSNTGFLATKKALLVYAPSNPSVTEPSAGYHVLGTSQGKKITTKTIPMPLRNDALRVEGKALVQAKQTVSALGIYAYNVVS